MKRLLLILAVSLSSCSGKPEAHRPFVLERNSPAIGENGALVENVGLETLGGVFTPLLRTGCVTPCKVSEIFSTAQDNQGRLQVRLFRGAGSLVSETHALGTCHIVNIPAAPRGHPQIEVTVEAAEREIRLSAFDMAADKPLPTQCEGTPAS